MSTLRFEQGTFKTQDRRVNALASSSQLRQPEAQRSLGVGGGVTLHMQLEETGTIYTRFSWLRTGSS
jgi:hypothetical protein